VWMEVSQMFPNPIRIQHNLGYVPVQKKDGGKIAELLGTKGACLFFTRPANIKARVNELIYLFGVDKAQDYFFRSPRLLTFQRLILTQSWDTLKLCLGEATALDLCDANPNVLGLGEEGVKWSLSSFEDEFCKDFQYMTKIEVAAEYPKRLIHYADVIAEPETIADSFTESWKAFDELEDAKETAKNGNEDSWEGLLNLDFDRLGRVSDFEKKVASARPIM